MTAPTHREYWIWRTLDPVTGKRSSTRYRMTEADALATDPTAERVEGSMELRSVEPSRDAAHLASVKPSPPAS